MSPNVFDKIEEKRQKSEENDDGDEEVVLNSDQRQIQIDVRSLARRIQEDKADRSEIRSGMKQSSQP